jgi:hypothetical protein
MLLELLLQGPATAISRSKDEAALPESETLPRVRFCADCRELNKNLSVKKALPRAK